MHALLPKYRLETPTAFLLCGDANQIVHPNFFSWSKVKSLFYAQETEAVAAPDMESIIEI